MDKSFPHKKASTFPKKPYIPSGATCIYKGTRIDLYTLPQGKKVREFIDHPGAVVILPFLDPETVVLISNERFAVGETLWELPAGTLELNETPEVTAKRELEEETGYKCKQLNPLLNFYSSPGFCNERMFTFCAKELELVGQHLDENEKITVEAFPISTVEKMLKDGTIRDAKSLVTLLFWLRNHH